MKSKFYLLILLIIFHVRLSAQFYNIAPCYDTPPNGADFDWTAQTYTIYTISHGAQVVNSPFYESSLDNQNINEFSAYAVKDFSPQDGWVFLKKNFGTSTTGTDFPYLILYNKHSGTLRVFMAFGQLYGQNDAATITLTYGNNSYRSAMLENYNGQNYYNALDNFTNNVSPVKINNYFSNSVLYWFHADFVMNYDPCTCNYNSTLLFSINLASNGNLHFTLDGTAIQNLQPGTDGYGRTGQIGNQSNLSNLGAVGSTFNNIQKGINFIKPLADNSTKWQNLDPANQNFFSALSTDLGGIGSVLSFANFFVGLFGGGSSAPVKPLAFNINLTGSGTISYTNPYGTVTLPIPGGNGTGLDPNTLTHYNNALGVFNLITTPTTILTGEWIAYGGEDPWGTWFQQNNEYYISMPNDIKYTINPNAGLSLDPQYINLSACYEYKYADETAERQSPIFPLGCFKYYQPAIYEYYWNSQNTDGSTDLTDHMLEYFYLKIIAKFKTADLTKDVLYENRYYLANAEQGVNNNTPPGPDILPPDNCSEFTAPASASEIATFCNSSTYQSKVTQFAAVRDTFAIAADTNVVVPHSLKVSPNPSADHFVLSFSLEEDSYVRSYLADMNGKVAKEILPSGTIGKGEHTYEVNTTDLAGGIYALVFISDKGMHTEKIIHMR